jgi:hypothetical protein
MIEPPDAPDAQLRAVMFEHLNEHANTDPTSVRILLGHGIAAQDAASRRIS